MSDWKKYALYIVVLWVGLIVYDNYVKAPVSKVLPKAA